MSHTVVLPNSTITVGRAGFILDNLIAEGKAKPMIVVMPHGHTGPFTMGRDGLPLADFVQEFNQDIKPYIEDHYLVLTDRANTSIAGLSTGGAHTWINWRDYLLASAPKLFQ